MKRPIRKSRTQGIGDLADQGMTRDEIADALGIAPETVAEAARNFGIPLLIERQESAPKVKSGTASFSASPAAVERWLKARGRA